MEMHQIRYFLVAAELLNFTRAAERCDVSQPALTQGIKRLEEQLGSQLFHRDGRSLVLSEFGQLMLPRLRALADQAEAAAEAARNFRLLRQAPLSIGVLPTLGTGGLSRFLASFQSDNPGIEVAVNEMTIAELMLALEKGTVDVAAMSAPDELPDFVRARPLYDERYIVLLPPEHPLRNANAVKLSDLSGEPYVDRLACEMREKVMAVCQSRGIELYAKFRSNREDWVQGMVAAGIGFAFMPEYSVTLTGLVVRPLIEPEVVRTVMLVSLPGRRFSPAAQAFVSAAARHPWP